MKIMDWAFTWGIEKVEVEKVVKDYIKIEYQDGGNLYVLATGLDVIQKYASADAKRPKLNKLGTQEWNRSKKKAQEAAGEVAKDLVELYAARQNKTGFQYGPDTVWQREFEEMFPFEETEGQLLAITSAKEDMESTRIMDRLVCGDVGYGKTESQSGWLSRQCRRESRWYIWFPPQSLPSSITTPLSRE